MEHVDIEAHPGRERGVHAEAEKERPLLDEQVIVQYYATEGIFSDDVRIAADPVTKWTARRESAGRTITMWMVLRDDRGGVDWTSRTVQVQ